MGLKNPKSKIYRARPPGLPTKENMTSSMGKLELAVIKDTEGLGQSFESLPKSTLSSKQTH